MTFAFLQYYSAIKSEFSALVATFVFKASYDGGSISLYIVSLAIWVEHTNIHKYLLSCGLHKPIAETSQRASSDLFPHIISTVGGNGLCSFQPGDAWLSLYAVACLGLRSPGKPFNPRQTNLYKFCFDVSNFIIASF